MNLLSYFFPQTILKTYSPYNREIRVNLESGRYKLLVNGSRQSGAYIEKLWKHAFQAFSHKRWDLLRLNAKGPTFLKILPESTLVLGVGGGTVIRLLSSLYPNTKIIGVDIDQAIIDIGNTYFRLDELSQLHIVCCDAQQYVRRAKKNTFDLVVVDLFSGRDIPDFVFSEEFLRTIKKILRPNGAVLINYLRELEYEEKSERLHALLQKNFSEVNEDHIARNRFFFAR